MKIHHYSTLTTLACLAFLSLGTLNANEEANENRKPLTASEEHLIQEERLSHFPKELLQSTGLYDYKEDFQDYQYLSLIHPNAAKSIIGCSDNGDEIALIDQTHWSIALFHRGIVKGWKSDDLLYIKPKCSWFSYFSYVIQNRTTSEVADANILSIPLLNVPGSLTIESIDVNDRIVKLSDHTFWQINRADYSFRKWRVGDRLIVGVNNYWRMDSYAHILINTSYYNKPYCEAKFLGN
jgi:hypothetical protein